MKTPPGQEIITSSVQQFFSKISLLNDFLNSNGINYLYTKKMSGIVVKYNRLNKTARQELSDFMDFLLSKQKTDEPNFLTAYKNKILNVSVWSDSDLKIFEENQKLFDQWSVQEW